MWVKLLFYEGKQVWWTNTTKITAIMFPQLVHMKFIRSGFIYDDGGHSPGLPLHWIGPAAFQFRGSLTIELWVAVDHRGDSDQHLPFVSLDHQLQLPARLLDQLPCVAERQVFCHCTVNLTERERKLEHSQILLLFIILLLLLTFRGRQY